MGGDYLSPYCATWRKVTKTTPFSSCFQCVLSYTNSEVSHLVFLALCRRLGAWMAIGIDIFVIETIGGASYWASLLLSKSPLIFLFLLWLLRVLRSQGVFSRVLSIPGRLFSRHWKQKILFPHWGVYFPVFLFCFSLDNSARLLLPKSNIIASLGFDLTRCTHPEIRV